MSENSAASERKPMTAQADAVVKLHGQTHETAEELWGLGARYDWPIALKFMRDMVKLNSGMELKVPYPVVAQVVKIRYTVAETDNEAAEIFNANNEWLGRFGSFHFHPEAHVLVGASHNDSMSHDWPFTSSADLPVRLKTDNWNVVFLSILHDLARHAQHHAWATEPSREVVYAIRGLRIFIEEDAEYFGRGNHFHKRAGIHPVSTHLMTWVGQELEHPSTAALPWHPGACNLLRAMLQGAERDRFLTEVVSKEQLQEGKVDPGERMERIARRRIARTASACTKAFGYWEAYWTAYTTKYPQAHAAASLAKSSARSAFTPVARAQQF